MKSRASARTLEALIGISLGAGAGGVAGAASYSPSSPVEWVDEHGEVQARGLTGKEKATRSSRAGQAALMGVAAGAGGALGLSRILRSLRTAAERKALKDGHVIRQYMGPLEEYATDLARRSPKQMNLFRPTGGRPGDAERVRLAQDLIKKRTAKFKELLAVAEKERNKALFGGVKTHRAPKDLATKRVFSPQTHEGQIMNRVFGGPKSMEAFNRGPTSGPFKGRNMRGSYEDLVERLYRQGRGRNV